MKILIIGAGLFGSVIAHELNKHSNSVTVVDRRNHIGGNVYTYTSNNIVIHKYGAHIFRTNDEKIWNYINQFTEFNNFINSPLAIYKNELYNLPFNMNTFSKMWNIKTPDEARKIIESQCTKKDNPQNLEEFVLSTVGTDIYEKLIKGYTEKQWNKSCADLPVSIMKRIPIRYSYNNNYFNSRYQGIPIGGYTKIIEKLLNNSTILLNTDGKEFVKTHKNDYDLIIYTGCIDEFYDYQLGKLEYRSLRFETKLLDTDNFQGNAVVNYTDRETPFTRIIEHKWFDIEHNISNKTIISYEFPTESGEPYYPIETATNLATYEKYVDLSKLDNIIFCGRLGSYKYTDMEDTIKNAISLAETLCK